MNMGEKIQSANPAWERLREARDTWEQRAIMAEEVADSYEAEVEHLRSELADLLTDCEQWRNAYRELRSDHDGYMRALAREVQAREKERAELEEMRGYARENQAEAHKAWGEAACMREALSLAERARDALMDRCMTIETAARAVLDPNGPVDALARLGAAVASSRIEKEEQR